MLGKFTSRLVEKAGFVAHNLKVVGSNPTPATSFLDIYAISKKFDRDKR